MEKAHQDLTGAAITSNGKQVRLAGISVYPLKSARGFSPSAWPVNRLGLAFDRQWLIASPDGAALTQREEPRLAFLAPTLATDHLALSGPDQPRLEVALEPAIEPEHLAVRIHDTTLVGSIVSAAADAWLARFLGYPARLVRVHEERVVNPKYAGAAAARTGFADAFPFLLLTEASLADLNSRLAQPLPMDRFRPNLVIAGTAPFAEDHWRRVRVGEVELAVVKPCSRCVITTTHQQTGERSAEPLRTLAGYRRGPDGKVLFGQNAIHLGTGTLGVGDVVSVLDPAAPQEP